LKGQTAHIGCGNYHSFAVNKDGTVRAWGLNSYGECGVPKDGPDDNTIVEAPTVVENLKGFSVKQIDGGGHHSIAVTESGQVLTWGRIDLSQGGMESSKYDKDSVEIDQLGKPRYLKKPAVLPSKLLLSQQRAYLTTPTDLDGEMVSAGTDSCLVITKKGQAYSWGFSDNYQTGQGDLDDVKEATLIDNSAIRGKKLCWAGAGGQFSILCGEAEDTPMTDA
jgi:regulator of chromosome condensation